MANDLMGAVALCLYHRHDFNIRVGDIGFRFYWVGDCYLFEIVLFFEDWRGWYVLHRGMYRSK